MVTGFEPHIKLPAGRPQPRKLLDIAQTFDVSGDNPKRWLAGVRWPQLVCGSLTATSVVPCSDGDQSATLVEQCVEWGSQLPFRLSDGVKASTLDFTLDELAEMSRELYDRAVSASFAAELISGIGSGGSSLSSEATAPDGAAFGSAATPIWNALAILEEEIADRLHGDVGYIHLPPGLLAQAVSTYGLMLVDGHWETPAGNVVISDAGYVSPVEPDGEAGSDPAEDWVYASGPIFYQRTDGELVGSGSETVNFADGHNRIDQFINGHGILVFDPCPVTAVLVSYSQVG